MSTDNFSIYKTDSDKRLVFGWASISITVEGEQLEDRQADMIDPEDLEEAAYEYVLKFRDTGEEHISTMRKKGKLVESCVFTKEKQKAMGIPEGILPVGWWIGFKIEDDAAWERVKNGTYKMFSIEGRANREPVEKSVDTVESVAKTFDEILKAEKPDGPTGCGVLVIRNGKVLTGTRIERGGRGKMCGPGGHIEAGETPEEAAKREAYEEFGIECVELTPLGVQDGGRYGKSAVFMCSKFSGTPKTDEKEMTEAEWVSPDDIDSAEAFPPFMQSLELLKAKKGHIAKTFAEIKKSKTFDEIEKFNPYHDALGRFTSGGSATSFTFAPGKSKAHDSAIEREKESSEGTTYKLYHGSPNKDIKSLDISHAGKNTSSGEKLIYLTDSKDFAEEFSYERLEGSTKFTNRKGEKGRVYEVEAKIKRPLDLRNLSDEDVQNVLELDADGLLTPDIVKLYSQKNNQLLKAGLDLRSETLQRLGYDGLIANDGRGSVEYAVVSNAQVKITS